MSGKYFFEAFRMGREQRWLTKIPLSAGRDGIAIREHTHRFFKVATGATVTNHATAEAVWMRWSTEGAKTMQDCEAYCSGVPGKQRSQTICKALCPKSYALTYQRTEIMAK